MKETSQLWSNLSSYKESPEKILRLQRDSNPWPPRYRSDALPTELWSYEVGQVWGFFICSSLMIFIIYTSYILYTYIGKVLVRPLAYPGFFLFVYCFLPLPRLPLFQKLSYVEHKELKNKHALRKKEAKGQTVNCRCLFNLKGTPCFTLCFSVADKTAGSVYANHRAEHGT